MITIRIGTIEDIKKIQDLHTELFKYEDEILKLYNTEYDKSEDSQKYFTSRLSNKKNGRVFVAIEDEQVIGYLCAGIGKEEYREVHPYAEIESLFVSESYRGKSVGKLLMDEFKSWAKENGVKRLKVEVVHTNEKSLKYYLRENFKPTYLELEATLG